VAAHITDIDRVLSEHRSQLVDLPPPSRRAYEFLKGVQWDQLPVGGGATAPDGPRTMLAWQGLGSLIDRTADLLSGDVSSEILQRIGDAIRRNSREIELTIERKKMGPERMSAVTREQRAWLGYFSILENLEAYVGARREAAARIDAAAVGSRHYPPPVRIQFRHIGSRIYRLQEEQRGGPSLALPTPMIACAPTVFADLGEFIYRRDNEARRRIIEAMTGEAYQSVRAELEALGGIVEQTRGVAHDLAASFDRVNAAYFAGDMPRPRLTWNRTLTGRKFGHYDFVRDTVMVSRTLDAPHVPEFVVDFLMFHELLHKFHGIHWVNGRGYAHTSEFSQSERKFARYKEAEEVLNRLAR
jgi:hypothetical protein